MKRCNWKRLLPYCKIIRTQHLDVLYLKINFEKNNTQFILALFQKGEFGRIRQGSKN